MPILLFITIFLLSCSDNLFYNEAAPHVSIELSNSSDTAILLGDTIYFKAKINPSAATANLRDYYWIIDSNRYSQLNPKEVFEKYGVYKASFHVTDNFGDKQSFNLSINVSSRPVCSSLSLREFQGSPIFKWSCSNADTNSALSYNFLLKNENKILEDINLQDTTLQLGYPLPNHWKASITAISSYGFRDELDSAWSAKP